MSALAIRPHAVLKNVNWTKVLVATAVFIVFAFMAAHPAFAFSEFESKVTAQTEAATGVAQKVLLSAAVLALIIGFAPMLWGQVKVKWIVTGCIACVMFGLAGSLVSAFGGA